MKLYPYAKPDEDPIFAAVGEKEVSLLCCFQLLTTNPLSRTGASLSDSPRKTGILGGAPILY